MWDGCVAGLLMCKKLPCHDTPRGLITINTAFTVHLINVHCQHLHLVAKATRRLGDATGGPWEGSTLPEHTQHVTTVTIVLVCDRKTVTYLTATFRFWSFFSHFDVEQEGSFHGSFLREMYTISQKWTIMLPTDEPLDQPGKLLSAFRLDKIWLNNETD